MLEIEVKSKIDDISSMKEKIAVLGGHYTETRHETDHYFNHPSRDFRETGEAFRIRVDDDGAMVTYKGPKLGGMTKTRMERETGVDDSETMRQILDSLGFRPAGIVEKTRCYYEYGDATLTLDSVKGLGDYIEIEMIGEDRTLLEPRVLEIASSLGITVFEKRSYLSMVLGVDEE